MHFINQTVSLQRITRIFRRQTGGAAPFVAPHINRRFLVAGADGVNRRLHENRQDRQVVTAPFAFDKTAAFGHFVRFVHQAVAAQTGMAFPQRRSAAPDISEQRRREGGAFFQRKNPPLNLRPVGGVGPEQGIGRCLQADDRAIGLVDEVGVTGVVVQIDDAARA